jgi:hypothetical protein
VAALVLIVAGFFAAWHLKSWPARLRYPGELDFAGMEGMRLVEMLDLRRGEPIYAPVTPEKFDASIYGPLYYILGAHLVDPQAPAYMPLRLLSLLATLGCAAGCALLAFWLSGRCLAAALAPLLFFSCGIVTRYGVLARCDMVALLLCFGGFLIAYRFRCSYVLLLAVPVMLLGFFYKQQFVAAPLAVLLFLMVEKRHRLAVAFGVLLMTGGLGGLLIFQFKVFPGQAFFRHFVVYNLLPFSLSQFALGFAVVGVMCLGPLLASLEFLYLHRDKLATCYLSCALAVSLLEFAKEGSGENFFLECVIITSALFAALMAESISQTYHSAMLVILLGATVLLGTQFSKPTPAPSDWARDRELQTFLRRNVPPHASALGLFTGDLVRAGLEAPISDLYQYTQLASKGTFSDRYLVRQVLERRYAVILLNLDIRYDKDSRGRTFVFLSEAVRHAILQNYQLSTEMEMPGPEKRPGATLVCVWLPRSAEGTLQGTPVDMR